MVMLSFIIGCERPDLCFGREVIAGFVCFLSFLK